MPKREDPAAKDDEFLEELTKMKESGYISEDKYQEILQDRLRFQSELNRSEVEDNKETEIVNKEEIDSSTARFSEKEQKRDEQHKVQTYLNKRAQANKLKKKTMKSQKRKFPQGKIEKTAKKRSFKQQTITLTLYLGVVLLVISGFVWATTTWNTLGSVARLGLLSLVIVLFYGLSELSKRVLKLPKTALAFHLLGSLFLPIILLLISYFNLLGSYLAIDGAGNYVYGLFSSILLVFVYLIFSLKKISRLYLWLLYTMMSITLMFALEVYKVSMDGFVFGLILFTYLLVYFYKTRNRFKGYEILFKDIYIFIQVQLILTTMCVFVLFESSLVNGLNMLLVAGLYLIVLFITGRIGYYYPFVLTLLHGLNLIIHSGFGIYDYQAIFILYPLASLLFYALTFVIKDKLNFKQYLYYTSGFLSVFIFLILCSERVFGGYTDSSMVHVLSYMLLTANVLSVIPYIKKQRMRYIATGLAFLVLLEISRFIGGLFHYKDMTIFLLATVMIGYLVLGIWSRSQYLKPIRLISRDLSMVLLSMLTLYSFFMGPLFKFIMVLIVIALLTPVMERYEKRAVYRVGIVAPWLHLISFSLVLIYSLRIVFTPNKKYYLLGSFGPNELVITSILLLGCGYLYQKYKTINQLEYQKVIFIITQATYYLATINSFAYHYNIHLRFFIVLGAVFMMYKLNEKIKKPLLPYLTAGLSLIAYIVLIFIVHMHIDFYTKNIWLASEYVIGGAVLVGLGYLWRNKQPLIMRAYYHLGHTFLLLSLLVSYRIFGTMAILAFIATWIVYFSAIFLARNDYIKVFSLYANYLLLFIILQIGIIHLEIDYLSGYIAYFVGAIMLYHWWKASSKWREWITLAYLVFLPLQSIYYVFAHMTISISLMILIIMHTFVSIYLLKYHGFGRYWFIPLFIQHFYFVLFASGYVQYKYILILLYGLGLFIWSEFKGRPVIWLRKRKIAEVDWLKVSALFTLFYLTGFDSHLVFSEYVPGVLIALLIFNERRYFIKEKAIFGLIAGMYLMRPYYVLLSNVELPSLFEIKLYLLPILIFVTIFWQLYRYKYGKLVESILWSILTFIGFVLFLETQVKPELEYSLVFGLIVLVSVVGGFISKMKSFFMIGSILLLLIVLAQTQEFWRSLPWWLYLLIAGAILIGVASRYEWLEKSEKQDKQSIFKRIKMYFKDWK